jgi:inner membrane protein
VDYLLHHRGHTHTIVGSLAPGWIPAERCAHLSPLGTAATAQLAPVVQATKTDEVAWIGELAIPAELLADLASNCCAVDALLQFARAPWAASKDDGWVVGDLRYDQEPGLGFAEVEVGPSEDGCPRLPAPWVPPRQDLLDGN